MRPLRFLDQLAKRWGRVNVSNVAAALTYWAVLALFPFLLFMVAFGSFFVGPSEVRTLVLQLTQVAPTEVATLLGERIQSLATRRSVGLVVFGAITSFLSASGGIVSLMRALNAVRGVREDRPFWKVRLIAFAATLGTAIFGLVAALIAVAAPLAAKAAGPFQREAETLVGWLRLPLAALIMIVLWGTLYCVLPDVKPRKFHLFTPGAVVGVVLWLAASSGFSFYVQNFGNFDVTYGALGGIIVLLLWLYLSSTALLLGALINDVLAAERQARRERRRAERRPWKPHPALEAVLGAVLLGTLLRLRLRSSP